MYEFDACIIKKISFLTTNPFLNYVKLVPSYCIILINISSNYFKTKYCLVLLNYDFEVN